MKSGSNAGDVDIVALHEIARAAAPDIAEALASRLARMLDNLLANALAPVATQQRAVSEAVKALTTAVGELAAVLASEEREGPSPIEMMIGKLNELAEQGEKHHSEMIDALQDVTKALVG